MTDEEICAQLYRDLCEASIAKDAERIATVLDDGYELVHMTGMRQSKRAYIAAVLDGTLNYYSTEHDSIDVTIAPSGETAAIRGRSRVNAAVFGGGRHAWRLQQEITLQRTDGVWRMTRAVASTY